MRVNYLLELKKRLESLDIPIHWEMPDPKISEPFLVMGVSTGNNEPTAKTNRLIRDDMQQIDIFLSKHVGRVEAERTQIKAVQLLGRSRNTSSELLIDDTTGREVYHIVIRLENIIY